MKKMDLNKIPIFADAFGDELKNQRFHDRLLKDIEKLSASELYNKYVDYFIDSGEMIRALVKYDMLKMAENNEDKKMKEKVKELIEEYREACEDFEEEDTEENEQAINDIKEKIEKELDNMQ